MNAEDMCTDYELKFRVKIDKLYKDDIRFGLYFNRYVFESYCRPFKVRYLCLCLFKYELRIGFIV